MIRRGVKLDGPQLKVKTMKRTKKAIIGRHFRKKVGGNRQNQGRRRRRTE